MQTFVNPGEASSEYRPELIPRRGEAVAWGLALVAGAGWYMLRQAGSPAHAVISVLAVILLLSGALISLSNWVDRRTVLRLTPERVEFENGLRRVQLAWEEVQVVHVIPSNLGDKVRVTGKQTYFSFRMLGEVHMHGELKGQMGFAEGKEILQRIISRAGLKRAQKPGEGDYYTRE